MEEQKTELKMIRMSEIESQEVKWLWYPFIPYGKLTIIQGDPGDGKTTLVLNIAANICRVLFNEEIIQKKLKKYEIIIKLNKNQEQERLLRKKIDEQNKSRQKNKNKMIKAMYTLIVPMVMALLLIIFMQLIDKTFLYKDMENFITMLFSVMIAAVAMCVSIMF